MVHGTLPQNIILSPPRWTAPSGTSHLVAYFSVPVPARDDAVEYAAHDWCQSGLSVVLGTLRVQGLRAMWRVMAGFE